MFVSLITVAQTSVREDVVLTKYGGVGDTLNLDESINDTYYIKDFSTDSELFWDIDSVSGTPRVLLEFNGSYDNSNWIVIDTATVGITAGTAQVLKVQSSGTYLYPYLQAKATARDNTQTIRYKYVLVIKKN